MVSQILLEVIFEVADTVEVAENTIVKIDLIDKVLGVS